MSPTLWVTVGLPRSGKSTWARSNMGQWPVVNRDSVRRALHGSWWNAESEGMVAVVTHLMVKALFLAGHPVVVLDECNVTENQRRQWLSNTWTTRFKVFDTPPTVCKSRFREDEAEGINAVIDRMAGEWEDPAFDRM